MWNIAVIQLFIPHYRIEFFRQLYKQGKKLQMNITVFCSFPPEISSDFPVQVLPRTYLFPNSNGPFWMRGLRRALKGTDIIIAPQKLICLTIPWLWSIRKSLARYWIWWGHGFSFTLYPGSSWKAKGKEQVRHYMTKRGDGILTYTQRGADFWKRSGMNPEQVVPYFNTIDVERLKRTGDAISHSQCEEIQESYHLKDKKILLFSGRMYTNKRVDFLLHAFSTLKKTTPHVALFVLGNGPERPSLEKLRENLQLDDVHFLGEIVDPAETAVFFRLADLLVLPGTVGLAIVHGFSFGLPMVTTDHPFHSPEIEYLLPGVNGVMTPMNEDAYSTAIKNILHNPDQLEDMKKAAKASGDKLLLTDSVQRFLNGITMISKA